MPKAIKYTVFWGSEEGEYRNLEDTKEHSMKLPGLKRGERYNFAVSAWNAKGESDYSNEVVILNDFDSARAPHYLNRGNELLERGYFLDAHLYFTTAIRLDPNNPRTRQALDFLIACDIAAVDNGILRPLEVWGVYRPKPGNP